MDFISEQIKKMMEDINTIVNLENDEERQEYIKKNFPGTKIDNSDTLYFLIGVAEASADNLKNYVTSYMRLKKESEEALNDFISNY